jgi:hypothetical protein
MCGYGGERIYRHVLRDSQDHISFGIIFLRVRQPLQTILLSMDNLNQTTQILSKSIFVAYS